MLTKEKHKRSNEALEPFYIINEETNELEAVWEANSPFVQ